MGIFTKQLVTIQANDLQKIPGTRNPVSGFQTIAENVPCRITGTHTDDQRLFILKKYYDSIPGGIHKGYKIIDKGQQQQGIDNIKKGMGIGNLPGWICGSKDQQFQEKV